MIIRGNDSEVDTQKPEIRLQLMSDRAELDS